MENEPVDTFKTEYPSMNEFKDAFVAAKPGETIVYATGQVAGSRMPLTDEFKGLKRMVQDLHDEGVILLTQKRVGFQCYQYRATKRAVPYPTRYFRDWRESMARDA